MRVRLATTALLAAATIGSAHAGTIFSTFGPGQTFNSGGIALTVNGGINGESAAEPFTPGSNTSVGSVALALYGSAAMSLTLETDASGAPSGSGTVIAASFTPNNASAQVFSFLLSTPVAVTAGTQYWLVAQSASVTGDSWAPALASVSSPSASYQSVGSTSWTSLAPGNVLAFSVSTPASATVPEPASLPLLGTGMLLALALARRPRGTRRA